MLESQDDNLVSCLTLYMVSRIRMFCVLGLQMLVAYKNDLPERKDKWLPTLHSSTKTYMYCNVLPHTQLFPCFHIKVWNIGKVWVMSTVII